MQIQKIISMYNNGRLTSLCTLFDEPPCDYSTLEGYLASINTVLTNIEQKYNVTLTLDDCSSIITVTYND